MMQRVKKVITAAVIVTAAGFIYWGFINITGFAIPCVFHLITGLYCPGCGVTGMCISLIQLDFLSAFKNNAAILCSLPVFILLSVTLLYSYIKTGSFKCKRWQNIAIYVLIVYFLIFAILRNIPQFSFLAPY